MTTHAHVFAPGVVPLRLDHAFFRTSEAAAFWEQLPFHVPQRDDQSCGLASLTQVANALRARRSLTAVTQEQVAEILGKPDWTGGVVLAELEALGRRALEALDVPMTLARRHASTGDARALAAFREGLAGLVAGRVLIVVNYLLAPILGVPLGHYSPIGAFDAETDRILVLDTYRQGWEAYWVPTARLWEAMCAVDPDAAAPRGHLELWPSEGRGTSR